MHSSSDDESWDAVHQRWYKVPRVDRADPAARAARGFSISAGDDAPPVFVPRVHPSRSSPATVPAGAVVTPSVAPSAAASGSGSSRHRRWADDDSGDDAGSGVGAARPAGQRLGATHDSSDDMDTHGLGGSVATLRPPLEAPSSSDDDQPLLRPRPETTHAGSICLRLQAGREAFANARDGRGPSGAAVAWLYMCGRIIAFLFGLRSKELRSARLTPAAEHRQIHLTFHPEGDPKAPRVAASRWAFGVLGVFQWWPRYYRAMSGQPSLTPGVDVGYQRILSATRRTGHARGSISDWSVSIGTDDIESAYRQCPSATPQSTVVAVPRPGDGGRFFVLPSMNFGLKSVPTAPAPP